LTLLFENDIFYVTAKSFGFHRHFWGRPLLLPFAPSQACATFGVTVRNRSPFAAAGIV
jgi:hypothetical protein